MAADVKTAVMENMAEIEKAISEKSIEVAKLKEELGVYASILALLTKKAGSSNGGRHDRVDMKTVLRSLPDTFTSKDFVAAASMSGISSLYLRQMLTRWTKQGKLKRLRRGKYQKTKKASAERLVA
jgi:hypothetical protein